MSRIPRLRNPAGFEFGHDAEIRAKETAPEFRYLSWQVKPTLDAGLKAVSSQADPAARTVSKASGRITFGGASENIGAICSGLYPANPQPIGVSSKLMFGCRRA